jgi:uncharacterized protein
MYNLTRQVGEANRHAVVACALMSGAEPPVFPDNDPDIAQLKERIATVIDFIQALPSAEINAAAEKEVTFTFRNGSQRKFTGRSLLLTFSVPQFFFHVTTAYDILRHCGVDLVKKDFLGTPDPAAAGVSELHFAADFPREIFRGLTLPGHFAFELIESTP